MAWNITYHRRFWRSLRTTHLSAEDRRRTEIPFYIGLPCTTLDLASQVHLF